MSVYIKRLVLLVAITFIAVGVRLYDNGLCSFIREGEYSVYSATDEVTEFSEVPMLNKRGAYERIDLKGGERDIKALLERMNATIIKEERFEDITVVYAFCPRISNFVEVEGAKVNIMIALSNGKMTVGSPLIKGSY